MSFSLESFIGQFKDIKVLNDYFASFGIGIDIPENFSKDQLVELFVKKFNSLPPKRREEIENNFIEVSQCGDEKLGLEKLKDITKARNAQWAKINSSLKLDNILGKVKEITNNIEIAVSKVSALNKPFSQTHFYNEYKLFEVDVLNTVKMIDESFKYLSGLSSMKTRLELQALKKYFYKNKDTIYTMSALSSDIIPKPIYSLDLYYSPNTNLGNKYNSEEIDKLIYKKLADLEKEVKALVESKKEVSIESNFDQDKKKLVINGIEIYFSRAEKQYPIIEVIYSDITKKSWTIVEIAEAKGEHMVTEEDEVKEGKYLRNAVRSINDKVKRAGFHDKFLEYKGGCVIIHI